MRKKETVRLFGTDGVRAVAGRPPLDRKGVARLGYAAGKELIRRSSGDSRTLVVARDTRSSGSWIEAELARGLSAAQIELHFDAVAIFQPC
jgi:phosphoglucosamine mutase